MSIINRCRFNTTSITLMNERTPSNLALKKSVPVNGKLQGCYIPQRGLQERSHAVGHLRIRFGLKFVAGRK